MDGDTEATRLHEALLDALLAVSNVIGLHEGPERHEVFFKPPSIDLERLPHGTVAAIRTGMDLLMVALGAVDPERTPVAESFDDAVAALLERGLEKRS